PRRGRRHRGPRHRDRAAQATRGRARRPRARSGIGEDQSTSAHRMMDTICPRGHPSLTTDYCDQCGTPIAIPSAAAAGEVEISSVTEVRMAEARAERCPACKTPRTAGDRYCEVDGYDFERTSESVVVWCA